MGQHDLQPGQCSGTQHGHRLEPEVLRVETTAVCCCRPPTCGGRSGWPPGTTPTGICGSLAFTEIVGSGGSAQPEQDATYTVRRGLSDSSCYSFEGAGAAGRGDVLPMPPPVAFAHRTP
ncbi:AbfB domain-containing protein [Streptomyces sp. NPDC058637]|uniref:AbfB domain-containing protein n=1 Tax=Streptomyces sp. NPDC058637 TaxID=3346569 RepID=UPI00366060BF